MKQPHHKFNGGVGATLCAKCRRIISLGETDDLLCPTCDATETAASGLWFDDPVEGDLTGGFDPATRGEGIFELRGILESLPRALES